MTEMAVLIVLAAWVVVFALEDRYTGMPKDSDD